MEIVEHILRGDQLAEERNDSSDDEPLVDALDQFDNDDDVQQPIEDISGSLLGVERMDVEDIYKLYCNHAAELGFSVRRSSTKYNSSGQLVGRVFVCSCEGNRKSSACSSNMEGKKRKMFMTRTNCMASLRTRLVDNGSFQVVDHNNEYNHTLTRKKWNYMHRSQRSISSDKAILIEDMVSSGIRPIDTFRYMSHDTGGEHLLGHIKVDHLNYCNRLKMSAIEAGDAQTLIDTLQQMADEDADFFFRVKLDDNGKLCNVFWRDAMMKEDYKIFGDVVVFDTTYTTNRYNLICAPFVGVNNHWKNVMFGCAFISNEKTGSFEWLFEVFKKSMGGCSPITVITDQDQAISNALETIFPQTKHRLCIWHLKHNALGRLGKLKSVAKFKEEFKKCLTRCRDVDDFESCWSSMISTYELQENEWFERLYSLREKWCIAYNKDYFSAGMLSSQRSESTNAAISFHAKKTTSLTEFYTIFGNTVQRWRNSEAADEFQCSRAAPNSCLELSGLLKHASEVYTLTLFKDFEEEFITSISTPIKMLHTKHDIKLYEMTGIHDTKPHLVTFYMVGNLVTCTCKKFEEFGILCSRCLRILHVHSITVIPDCYIKNRWKKSAKQELWDKFDRIENSEKSQPCTWRNQMMRMCYSILVKAQDKEEARLAVQDAFTSVMTIVQSLFPIEQASGEVVVSRSSHIVKNPSRSVTKGWKQRIKSHQKGKRSKAANVSASNQTKEFGTNTPNPRLF